MPLALPTVRPRARCGVSGAAEDGSVASVVHLQEGKGCATVQPDAPSARGRPDTDGCGRDSRLASLLHLETLCTPGPRRSATETGAMRGISSTCSTPDTLTIGVSRPSLDLAMDRLNRAVADLLGRDVNRFQHMLRQVAESRER
jgi:hypothetical protein